MNNQSSRPNASNEICRKSGKVEASVYSIHGRLAPVAGFIVLSVKPIYIRRMTRQRESLIM